MVMTSHVCRLCAGVVLLLATTFAAAQDAEQKDNVAGPYVPTPWVIVDEMLKLADITSADTV